MERGKTTGEDTGGDERKRPEERGSAWRDNIEEEDGIWEKNLPGKTTGGERRKTESRRNMMAIRASGVLFFHILFWSFSPLYSFGSLLTPFQPIPGPASTSSPFSSPFNPLSLFSVLLQPLFTPSRPP